MGAAGLTRAGGGASAAAGQRASDAAPPVLLTHGYPLREVARLCAAGELPGQHLWGADALHAAGHRVLLGPFGPGDRVLRHLTWRSGQRLGDLDEELGLLRRPRAESITYVGEAGMVRGLAYLRAAARWASPIVAVLHEVPPATRREAAWIRGLDVALCLSSADRQRLLDGFGRDPATTLSARWGPDLAHPGYVPESEELVVSVGKTDRDLETLTCALRDADAPGRVYAVSGEPAVPSSRVELIRPPSSTRSRDPVILDYRRVLADLRRAAIVAIPLRRSDRLLGLTELNDALALAKPVVMTRNPYVDVDVEAVGCGVLVEPGDVRGWREAVSALLADPARRRAMGAAGLAFARERWNSAVFGAQVVEAVRLAADRAWQPRARRG